MKKCRRVKREPAKGAIIGFFAGLSVAVCGAIKDAPYEGFDLVKFFRSPAVATIEGAAMGYAIPKVHPVLLFFATIGTERLTTETYKVIRAKMPMKFEYGEWGVPKTTG